MSVPILAVADDAKDAAAVVLRFFTTVSGESRVDFADVYRVRGGRIADHWHVVDTAALGALLAG